MTPEQIQSWAQFGAFGSMLGWFLWWFFTKHTPDTAKRFDDLGTKHEAALDRQWGRYETTLDKVVNNSNKQTEMLKTAFDHSAVETGKKLADIHDDLRSLREYWPGDRRKGDTP